MNYTSEDFHLQYISTYNLYVQSDLIYDQLVVLDQDKQVLVYMKYDNINPNTEAIKLLSLPFAQVYIAVPHQSLVWVPTEIFNASDKSLYVDYFVDGSAESIMDKPITSIAATALYQYDLFLMNRWKKLYPKAHFVSMFDILLKQAMPFIFKSGHTMGIHLYDSQADVFLFIDGEMHLYNTFEIATADDISYFILSILRNFDIKGKVDRILWSGGDVDAEYANRLTNYTTEIVVLDAEEKWKVNDEASAKELKGLNILKDSTVCVL